MSERLVCDCQCGTPPTHEVRTGWENCEGVDWLPVCKSARDYIGSACAELGLAFEARPLPRDSD